MIQAITRQPEIKLISWVTALVLGTWLVLPFRSVSAVEPTPAAAGTLLVATESMQDPRFVEAVIYLVKHDAEGTLGLVLNKPVAKASVNDLLEGFGSSVRGAERNITVHYGGPVSTRQGFFLHSDEITFEGTIKNFNGIAMTSDTRLVEAIAFGKGPRQFLMTLGYAGWAPGQLESELLANSWVIVPSDSGLVFGTDAEKKWRRAMDKRQIPL
jgi:putative transcriptional regulator